jgi:Zn-dependent protease
MMLALTHAPVFGWAKPVPVNYRRLGKPRRDMILVALAGPGMNLLLALLGTIILAITVATTNSEPGQVAQFVAHNAINFVFINIFLAVFNLIPVPPFDGGHVVEGLMPRPAARRFRRIGRYSLLVLVFLLLILPAISDSADIVGQVVSPVVDSIAIFLMGVAGLRIS